MANRAKSERRGAEGASPETHPTARRFARAFTFGVVGWLAAFTLFGCHPRPGGACKDEDDGKTACLSKTDAVACVKGLNVAIACRGPQGCREYSTEPDAGPNGKGCDHSLAAVGDGCGDEGETACTVGGREEVRCLSHVFHLASSCRGPLGCTTVEGKARCDDSVASVGDACEERDRVACAPDGKALHRCDGSAYRVDSACGGPGGCRLSGTSVACDHHVATVGDPCHADKSFACSADRNALLRCQAGHFQEEKRCASGCNFNERGTTTEFDCP